MRLAKRVLILIAVIVVVILGLLLFVEYTSGESNLVHESSAISKISIGKIYSTDENREFPNYNSTDGGYVKIVDNHRWIVINRNLGRSWEKTESFPSLEIMEGTYKRSGVNLLFNKGAKLIIFHFSNERNSKKKVYYYTSGLKKLDLGSGSHVSLKFSGGIYMYGSSPIYPARGTMPNSIAQFLKTSQYSPDTSPY